MPDQNFSQLVPIKGSYSPVSANALIKSGAGVLHKVVVNSHSSGTFRLYDGLTAVNPMGGTYTPATGSSVIDLNLAFNTGLYFVTGGTIDATISTN